jgi:DNA-binding IclR family transcriptional regulator
MSKIVERTLDFLELFADKRRPLSLSEIARLLDLPVSVLLAKTGRRGGTYLFYLGPSHPLRFTVKVGEKVRHLYASSAGKALLASLDKPDLEAFFKSTNLLPLTSNTITTKEALLADLEVGRRRKWFANVEESQSGLITLSAPFKWAGATYIATIAGPVARLQDRMDWAASQLVKACEALEAGQ